MSRINDAFHTALSANRMTFMPFATAGDPDLTTTREVLLALRDAEVDMIELGFPYSDPIADGPVIQASYTRALENGVTVNGIFEMMDTLRDQSMPPILAMVSYAIIFRYGVNAFAKRAAEAGFSGLIIPDLPAEEAREMDELAASYDLDTVQLVAPTTAPERVAEILAASRGFVYRISVAGTTGVRNELPAELSVQLQQLRKQTTLPLAVGFGIASPDQVPSLQGVADGVIVGSAVVRKAAEAANAKDAAVAVKAFAEDMVRAVQSASPSLATGV
ncbi:MAG: tryptophan synthase subunit alpha [Planctomycetaceae bacterium]